MATSLLDPAAPAAGYGAVSEDEAQLIVKARMERGSLSEPLGPEDRSVLSFHHISYSLPKRKFGIISAGRKTILNDLSGVMGPGLNAIMGPTGGGKTSLLDILAGRKSRKGVAGEVLINGQRLPKNYKCASGYVVQDDAVMGTLTVRENLTFSAALRLPSYLSFKQRKEKVDSVIEELGLTDCQHTRVGTEFTRGVSGGERKRCNIGMELIISPAILYLDEPTTGLDSSTATSVVQLLKKLSVKGRTIILSIHQPRYSIFKLFDSVTLLSKGDMVYHGPAGRALGYFAAHGYECEEHDNPADFFLDIIIQNEEIMQTRLSATAVWQNGTPEPEVARTSLAEDFKVSAEYQKVMQQVDPIADAHRRSQGPRGKAARYHTPFPWQLLVVTWRSWLNVLRNPMTSFLQVAIMIFFALLVGLIYLQLKHNVNGLTDRVGAIFFIIMNQVFGNLSATELFIKQRALFIHENASGFYRVSAYFIAKVLCDLIPLHITPVAVFSVIVYFMIGFQADAAKFFIFLLTLILTSTVASSIGFTISALVRQSALASLLIALCFVFAMVFGGFFINLSSIPVWLSWLQYLSLFKYSVTALSVNELSGTCFCNPDIPDPLNMTLPTNVSLCSLLPKVPQLPCVNGTEYLENQNFLAIPLWYNELALALMILLLLLLGYVILLLIKKEK